MKTKRIEDLEILLQAFTQEKTALHLPDRKTLVLSPYNMEVSEVLSANTLHGNVVESITDEVPTAKLFIDFTNEMGSTLPFRQKYNYICNPDGSMRWVWPAENKEPLFLELYNSQGIKAALIKLAIRLSWSLGLKNKFVHGSFTLHMHKAPFINTLCENSPYAIFTGTVGPDRKMVVYTENPKPSFIKIAASARSAAKISHEQNALQFISTLKTKTFQVPVAMPSVKNTLKQLSMANGSRHETTTLPTAVHYRAVEELSRKTLVKDPDAILAWKNNIDKRIWDLKELVHQGINPHLTKLVMELFSKVNNKKLPELSYAHGDFTPWNMYETENSLYLYDWEQSGVKPVLSDLFYYIFQSSVMIRHKSYHDFKNEIDAMLENPIIQKMCDDLHIDASTQMSWFLIDTVSYYLLTYHQQKRIHIQASWIMQAWSAAILERVEENPIVRHRTSFIRELFLHLQESPYVALKFTEGSIENISTSSDLDLLVTREGEKKIQEFIKRQHAIIKKEVATKSYMKTIRLHFADGSFVSLDLIRRFKIKWMNYMRPSHMIRWRGTTSEIVSVPQKRYDFEYILLFYIGNGSSVPQKYQHYFSQLFFPEKEGIRLYVNSKYNLQAEQLEDLYQFSKPLQHQLLSELKKAPANTGVRKAKSMVAYVLDTIKNRMFSKGRVISLSGVDGAGKSTILEEIKKHIEEEYREKIVVKRHRPSILPIISSFRYGKAAAEKMAATTLPRKGSNQSAVSSIFRFTYYYLDYLIGQLYIYFRYTSRGITVLYDRYYFDMIIDGERSNIRLPKWIPSLGSHLIVKPDLNILLYAPAETILKRKQELTFDDVVLLTENYLQLFQKAKQRSHDHQYVCVLNTDKNQSIHQIMYHYSRLS